MSKYWIRHRGNVSGPFPIYKMKSLARRGRFNRHYSVSTDGKQWQSAESFPQFFENRWQDDEGGEDDYDQVEDDYDHSCSGNDLDNDALPPEELEWQDRLRAQQNAEDEEDIEELEEVRSFRPGSLVKHLPRVNADRFRVVLFVGLCLWLVGIWAMRFRETWEQDVVDCDQLEDVVRDLNRFELQSPTQDGWNRLAMETQASLFDMVSRLEDSASARDHVKQELLFIARDDCRMAFVELPHGITTAKDRMVSRLARINEMITQQWRYHPASIIMPLNNVMADTSDSQAEKKQSALDALRDQLGENYDDMNEFMDEPGLELKLPPKQGD